MKKKGFTLIELLAVIVILVIIALIATPMIMGVIEDARKGAATSSAYGYVEAIENSIVESMIDTPLQDGSYKVKELLNVEYKGKGPSQGYITIENGQVTNAKLCINNYSIDYDGTKAGISELSYCDTNYEVTIIVNGVKDVKDIGDATSTEVNIEAATIKAISCNNNAIPKVEDNVLKIENIYGDTTCRVENNLSEIVNNLDNTKATIKLVNDTAIDSTITFKENTNVELDLNGKKITGTANLMKNQGNLHIYDSGNTGSIKASGNVVTNEQSGNLTMTNLTVQSVGNSNVLNYTIQNKDNGILTIDGGVYTADCIVIENQDSGNITITDTSGRLYLYTSADANNNTADNYPKTIVNQVGADNIIKILGTTAEKCVSTEPNENGICIYNAKGRSVLNETITTGNIYIDGAYIAGVSYAGVSNFVGTIYICNATIDNKKRGIYADGLSDGQSGYIYYTDQVKLIDSQIVSKVNGHAILDNTITCR